MTAYRSWSTLALLATLAGEVGAQGTAWNVIMWTSPPGGRGAHAMVHDSQLGVAVMFGGFSPTLLSDTWHWDGATATWTEMTPALPSPRPAARIHHAMAYDSQRNRTVMCGGQTLANAFFGDTWEWNGTAWTPFIFGTVPPRSQHAMVYDSQRSRTVLFGGIDAAGVRGDTLEWNGATWATVTPQAPNPSPPARHAHAMTYDSLRGQTVLFGGLNSTTPYLGDTWEWDGVAWTQKALAGGPPARQLAGMVYHDQLRRAVLYGGETAGAWNDTWEWDGTFWTPLGATGPARWAFGMVHDSQRKRTYLYGGNTANRWYADTWELVAVGAASTPFGSGCGLTLGGAGAVPPGIDTTAVEPITGIPAGDTVMMALGWNNQWFGPNPLPFSLFPYTAAGCDLLVSADLGIFHGTQPTGPGAASFSVAIPSQTWLLALDLYLQAWTLSANPIVSNGVHWVIGCP